MRKNNGLPERKTLKPQQLLLSEHTNNNFKIKDDFDSKDFTISYNSFRENIAEGLVLDPSGERYIKLVEAADGNRREHYIKEGEVSSIQNILFSNQIEYDPKKMSYRTHKENLVMSMLTGNRDKIKARKRGQKPTNSRILFIFFRGR